VLPGILEAISPRPPPCSERAFVSTVLAVAAASRPFEKRRSAVPTSRSRRHAEPKDPTDGFLLLCSVTNSLEIAARNENLERLRLNAQSHPKRPRSASRNHFRSASQ